eukprot:scaffold1976_cov134-Pinguiococcus_pyrenoidosus.AAC.1
MSSIIDLFRSRKREVKKGMRLVSVLFAGSLRISRLVSRLIGSRADEFLVADHEGHSESSAHAHRMD